MERHEPDPVPEARYPRNFEDRTDRRLERLETAMWGTEMDRDQGVVQTLRRMAKQNQAILVGVIVSIITPAATILLTKAAGS